jgi:hypothetical protein
MKQTLTIFLLFSALVSFGQDTKNLGKSFVMKQNYLAKKCDAVGNNLTSETDALERNFVIIIEAMTSTGYVISVPQFTKSGRKDELNSKFVTSREVVAKSAVVEVKDANGIVTTPAQAAIPAQAASEIYFLIPFAEFEKVCNITTSKHSFTVGIPTIPAKLRFGNGEKETIQDISVLKVILVLDYRGDINTRLGKTVNMLSILYLVLLLHQFLLTV